MYDINSCPESLRGFSWELEFFDTHNRSVVQRVINVRKIGSSWSLSHSPESVEHTSVADAHPAIVVSQIGDGDASQVSTQSRTHEDFSLPSVSQHHFFPWI